MTTLLVGFDSAWTASNSGALVGALRLDDGTFRDLGPPCVANYLEAEECICSWQAEQSPSATIILLDQPTIVPNPTGQRPVENLASSVVSRRYGGMQPASISRAQMFGTDAPLWAFLRRFGGAADPCLSAANTRVFETYPVLAMIALGWMLPGSRISGRLPKYNPKVRKNFALTDWSHVCALASVELRSRGLEDSARWIEEASRNATPRKRDQDCLDAYLCLLVALHLAEGSDCMMVGNLETGYIVVPYGDALCAELDARCRATGRETSQWVRRFRMPEGGTFGAAALPSVV